MTQQERAQVAFKVLGVALVIWALSYTLQLWPLLVHLLRILPASAEGSAGILTAIASTAGRPLVFGLLGIVVLWAAPFLARRLLPPTDPPLPLPEETLRGGVCLMGFCWLSGLVMGLLVAITALAQLARGGELAQGLAQTSVSVLVAAALGVAFAFGPRKVARAFSRLAGGPPRNLVAAGLCLIAGWWGTRALHWAAGALGQWFRTVENFGVQEDVQRRWALASLVNSATMLVLAVLLVLLSRRVASRLGARRDAHNTSGASVRLGGTAALALAVQVGVAYLFVGYLERLVRSPFFDWEGAEAVGALLHLLVVPAAVGFGVFWLAGRIAWPSARRLHKPSVPDAEAAASPPLHLLLEVALAVLAISYAIGFLESAFRRPYVVADEVLRPGSLHLVPESLLAGAAALVVLLFKGDLARLTVRGGAGEEPDRPARAALLRPWLVMLGVWVVLRDGPRLVSWAWELLLGGGSEWPASVPRWSVVPGLLLIFGARWLAGRLAYGPLIRRGGPRPAEA